MNNNIIDEVLDKTDIVSLIGSEIDLNSKGSNYIGLCPFHEDNTPSFTVSPEKKIYKCFSCGEGGNALTFTQKYYNFTFQEALAKLAKENGISYNVQESKTLKEHELLGYAQNFYNSTLTLSIVAAQARKYLNERNIDDKLIDKFRLGYSDQGDANFLKYFNDNLSEEFTMTNLNLTGLANNGHDFFFKRLMFPIHDENDNVVGFSGRALDEGNPKYLNSKSTEIFNKSRILYNLNNAKRHLEHSQVYIVEGFFDVISLTKIGIENAVATMGTAFTNDHIKLLKKYHVKNIVLGLDQDSPGKNATIEVGNLLLKNGIEKIDVLVFEGAKDIDEFILKNDISNLENNKINFFQFKMKYLQEKYNINDLTEKAKYISEVTLGVDCLEINLKNIILNELSQITQINVDRLIPNPQNTYTSPPPNFPNTTEQKIVKNANKPKLPNDDDVVIKFCMQSKENCQTVLQLVNSNKYKFDQHNTLFLELCKFYEINNDFDIIDFVDTATEDFFEEANKINKDSNLDIDKIDLILNRPTTKKKLTGLHIIRKSNR